MKKLQDKVAVITGGTTGIGQAAARLFHEQGACVYITGRNEKTLAEAQKNLPAEIVAIRSDASRLEDIDALAAEIKEKAGRIDVLYVNAGIAKFLPFESITPEIFDEMFNINFRGAYFTIQKLLPLMGEGSSIVLTTSIAADLGMATSSAYGATKAALSSLARTLSNELAPRAIRVNEVSPGPIETPIYGKLGMPQDQVEGFKGMMSDLVPVKRFGSAEEVAKAALFLASSDSSYLLGSKIRIDGGFALN
ncbi:MAG TPA: SDR family oxidoreductase [Burkholderiales bacterium]|nr:SDR family oxidoreductase [Burkholderiales bacterium]